MVCHVGILRKPYLDLVLTGAKTVESRLTKSAVPPFRCVSRGDRLFLKASGGAFMAMAVAGGVAFYEGLAPADVAALRERFNERVRGDAAYWAAKRDSRFATFIELREVEPAAIGPAYAKSPYKAWFTLPDEASPVLDVTLTAAAVRNRYVGAAGRPGFFGEGAFVLELPDGRQVETTLYRGQRVTWRGWGPYFETHGMTAGARVRFVTLGGGRYRVGFVGRERVKGKGGADERDEAEA